jgi:hydroxypyruvate reductase
MGLTPLILGDALEGEAREVGIVHAGIARSIKSHGEPLRPPAVLLSGGETTVTIGSDTTGRGGRNTTFLLGLAVALDGISGVWGIAGDTDGIDGMGDIAGAMLVPDTLARVRAKGLDPRGLLKAHDSHGFFDAVGDAIRIGPTLTNVNDFRAILIA